LSNNVLLGAKGEKKAFMNPAIRVFSACCAHPFTGHGGAGSNGPFATSVIFTEFVFVSKKPES
jgi:hypothetical protein